MRWWQRQGLRFKVALVIALTMFIILGGAFFGISEYTRAQLWQREVQAAKSLNAVAATLLDDAMMVGHKERIQEALEKLGQSVGGQIEAIAVYDDQAVLTSFASGFPEGRSIQRESLGEDVRAPTCWGCHQLPAEERPTTTVVSLEGKDVLRNVLPLYNEPRCQTCHGTGKTVLGDAMVDLRLDRYRQASTAITIALAGGAALAVVLVASALYLLLRRIVLYPLEGLVAMTTAVTRGDLTQRVQVRTGDELGQVGAAFNNMTAQLSEMVGSLEQRVAERTRELEQRSAYLETSSDVARAVASILDADTLIRQVVHLIKDRFGLYYVGLFLVDEGSEWAVLKAGTGKAGHAMLARGHRLKVGEGMIGWSIAHAEARVALDVGEDAVRFDTPDLPDTRSEAALPLRSRGQVLGALTIQSDQPNAFDKATLTTLQTMADQVALALDNAHLLAESQIALEAERRAYGELSREAWLQMARTRPDLGYVCDAQGNVRSVSRPWKPDMEQAAKDSQTIQPDARTVSIPLKVRGQVAGVVRLSKPDEAEGWTEGEISLMEKLAEQFAGAAESARLYQETQRRAQQEHLVRQITEKVRAASDIETIAQTAAEELVKALGGARAFVKLGERSQNDR